MVLGYDGLHDLVSYCPCRARTLLLGGMVGTGEAGGFKQALIQAGAPSAISSWPGAMTPSSGVILLVEKGGSQLAACHMRTLPPGMGGH